MSHDHIVELPKAVWAIKIVQAIICVLVLAFSAFTVAVIPNGYSGFCIFTAIFSGISLIYYFVSIHANRQLYNWIALLVLECLNVLWWLVVWALLATGLAAAAYIESAYDDGYYYAAKRGLIKRYDAGTWSAAGYLVYVTLAIGIINWILFCVTLGFLSMGIHRHRKAGKPMAYGGSSSSAWNNAPRAEKHDMQPISTQATYNNNNFAPNGQAPAPGSMNYAHQPQQGPGYQQPSYQASPVSANTHEVYGDNARY